MRREILVGLDVIVGVRSDDAVLLDRAQTGLQGEVDNSRYGLPFAGDNNFLFDRIDVLEEPLPARWYARMTAGEPPRKGSCRLTVGIDRSDSSRTTTALFAPTPTAEPRPPDTAWTWTPRAP